MVGSFETKSFWQGGFTEEQQKYYEEHCLSQKGKHLWEQIDKLYIIARNMCSTYNVLIALINLVAVGGINTSLFDLRFLVHMP
jgi:hypothetical protein